MNRRKENKKQSFITCAERPDNEIETQRNAQGRLILYFLDRETIDDRSVKISQNKQNFWSVN